MSIGQWARISRAMMEVVREHENSMGLKWKFGNGKVVYQGSEQPLSLETTFFVRLCSLLCFYCAEIPFNKNWLKEERNGNNRK